MGGDAGAESSSILQEDANNPGEVAETAVGANHSSSRNRGYNMSKKTKDLRWAINLTDVKGCRAKFPGLDTS